MRFKPGAFLPGVPVEPVIIRYNNDNCLDTTTEKNWSPGGTNKSFFLLMCQLFTEVEIEILPTYIPSQEEIEDPQLFADNVKEMMAKTVGIPVCPKPYKYLKSGGEHLEILDKAIAKFDKFEEELADVFKNAGSDLNFEKL